MAKQHKRDTRIPLSQVDLGNAVAESDGHLADYYYDNEYYESAMSLTDRHVFFVGGKGTGKSAILTMVGKNISGPKIIRLGADDIGMGLLSNTSLVDGLGAVDLGIIYKAIWDYLILINIVKAEFGTTKPAWWKLLVPKEENEVYELLDKTGELEEGSMKLGRAFVGVLKQLQLKISASIPSGATYSIEGKLGERIERDVGALVSEIGVMKHINRLRKELPRRCQHARFYVLIDDLDEGWKNTPAQRECLKALVKSLVRLSHFGNIRFLVALRSLILDQIEVDDPDKVREYVTTLRWTKKDLKEVVVRRLSVCLKRGREDIVNVLLPKSVQGMDPFNFMYSFLPAHPRAHIQFMQSAVDSAVQNNQGRIRVEDFQEAETRASEWCVEDIAFEYRTVYPGLKKVIGKMIGCKKEMSLAETRSLLREIVTWAMGEELDYQLEWVREGLDLGWSDNQDADNLCRALLKAGILGLKTRRSTEAEFFPANIPEGFSAEHWFKTCPTLDIYLRAK